MQRFILLGISVAFVIGIAYGSVLGYDATRIGTCLIVSGAVALWVAFRNRKAFFLSCMLLFFVAGVWHAARTSERYRILPEHIQVSGTGTVKGEESLGVFHARVVVALDDCGEQTCPQELIQVAADRYQVWMDGMRVDLSSCDLIRPTRFDPGFDYPMYLAKEGIGFVAESCHMAPVLGRENRLRVGLHRMRAWVSDALNSRMAEPEAGLARGLILGGSHELPESLIRDFRTVGLSHIVAVSGYNISVLAGGFLLLGIGLGVYRKQAVWLALLGVVCFVLLVGAPASAVRAALMAAIGFLALLAVRPVQAIPVLCFAAALMLAWNPLLFRYDIGFQLSFLATFAILVSEPWRSHLRKRWRMVRYGGESVLITVSVLLFVTPISVLYFGTLSPYAILANVLVLPIVPLAFFGSFLVMLLGWIPGVGALSGWVTYGVLHSIMVLVEHIARFPGADATFLGVSGGMVGWWYAGCLVFFLYWYRRESVLAHT